MSGSRVVFWSLKPTSYKGNIAIVDTKNFLFCTNKKITENYIHDQTNAQN